MLLFLQFIPKRRIGKRFNVRILENTRDGSPNQDRAHHGPQYACRNHQSCDEVQKRQILPKQVQSLLAKAASLSTRREIRMGPLGVPFYY